MKLQVVLSPKAKLELHQMAQWWAVHRSLQEAEDWYDGFIDALHALSQMPARYPLAHENDDLPYEIRNLHYGIGSHPTHRALFTIRPDMVFVLAIRHVAQEDVMQDDVSPS